jgi:hypothetical protein
MLGGEETNLGISVPNLEEIPPKTVTQTVTQKHKTLATSCAARVYVLIL